MEDKALKIISEHEAKDGDPLFRCIRGFYLPVVDGPQLAILPGDIVRLKSTTAPMHFYAGRIEPVNLPDSVQYEALQEFRTISPEGTYLTLYRGDRVEMVWAEAFPLLRQHLIKPINYNLLGGTYHETESTQELLSKK